METEKFYFFFLETDCIIEVIIDESIPPDKKEPTSTSDTKLSFTALTRISFNSSI